MIDEITFILHEKAFCEAVPKHQRSLDQIEITQMPAATSLLQLQLTIWSGFAKRFYFLLAELIATDLDMLQI